MASSKGTRELLLDELDDALDIAMRDDQFKLVANELSRIRDYVEALPPSNMGWDIFYAFNRAFAGGVLIKAAVFTAAFGSVLALDYAWEKLKLLWSAKVGLIVTNAYAATSGGHVIDPLALLVFQIVIALMVPCFSFGAFYALMKGSNPETRKAGRETLIALMGFVLGAATRFV